MRIKKAILGIALFSVCLSFAVSGCASAYKKMVAVDTDLVFHKIYITDYTLAWEAAIDALKASPMDIVNRETGTVQTKWIDNTVERNMLDSNGGVVPYVKAQYRFRVSLAKGFYEGKPSVRVTVQKEQQFQRDVLEGWKNIETDGFQENSLLYRVGKLIDFKSRMVEAENADLKKQLNQN